ncbi:MAG: NAD(P)/FAD-dependent oxidoreductase, partial [Planctomycetota bacterium]
MSDGYGVVVIGSGPGGYTAALEAARSGFRTALVERRPYLGGVCLNEGCIASKTLLSAADVLEEIERGGVFGVTASGVEQDWGRLQARRLEVIETLRAGVGGLLRAAKVDVVTGEARLGGAHEVVVTHEGVETVLSAERVVLATGSSPIVPGPWQGVDGVLTSTEMLSIDPLPKSATLVGGGVIGCEFASMMIRFGVDVRVIEMADRLLPMADEALSSALADALRRQGVVLHLGRKVERIEPGGDG